MVVVCTTRWNEEKCMKQVTRAIKILICVMLLELLTSFCFVVGNFLLLLCQNRFSVHYNLTRSNRFFFHLILHHYISKNILNVIVTLSCELDYSLRSLIGFQSYNNHLRLSPTYTLGCVTNVLSVILIFLPN